ncbi:unnamed protein product [Cladocopium goreaui]|uniref:Uncharacterized protein n=1 Tax=Cladocopium goreaui TaxID=2562237 RepID=A0A9P1CDL2_9DINO|nr:unnamed protein product [Cladocopium goreaui]
MRCCCWPRNSDDSSDDSSSEENQELQVDYDSLYFPPQEMQGRLIVPTAAPAGRSPNLAPSPLPEVVNSLKSLTATPKVMTPLTNTSRPSQGAA